MKTPLQHLLLLTVALMLPAMSAVGQITFTLSDLQDLIGESREMQTFETLNPGGVNTTAMEALVSASGADQTWDFTPISFEITGSGTTETRLLPADVPGADDPAFDGATHVTIISLENETTGADSSAWTYQAYDSQGAYSYGSFFESSQDVDGDGMAPDEVIFSYDPRYRTTALPLTFGTEWTSETTQSFMVAEQSFGSDIALHAEVDGYGTLITPSGSAPSLRVRRELSVTVFGFTTVTTSYDFITKEGVNAFVTVAPTGGRPRVPGEGISASYQTEGDVDTAIEQVDSGLPYAVRLDPNYPNPFNPQTTIRYALPVAQHVTLAVFDVLGREVQRLVDRHQEAGTYEASFNARGLAGGPYLYQLRTPTFTQSRVMLLSK